MSVLPVVRVNAMSCTTDAVSPARTRGEVYGVWRRHQIRPVRLLADLYECASVVRTPGFALPDQGPRLAATRSLYTWGVFGSGRVQDAPRAARRAVEQEGREVNGSDAQNPFHQHLAFNQHARLPWCQTCGERPDVIHPDPLRGLLRNARRAASSPRRRVGASASMRLHLLMSDEVPARRRSHVHPGEGGYGISVLQRPVQMPDHALPKQGRQGLRLCCRVHVRSDWRVDRVRYARGEGGDLMPVPLMRFHRSRRM
jgi:hypothetical protein